jgi:AraC family transcriptional regulator
MAYVRARRTERAKELLEGGCPLLPQVAAHLGFYDQSHFTRTFRKKTGTTPGQYARAHIPLGSEAFLVAVSEKCGQKSAF